MQQAAQSPLPPVGNLVQHDPNIFEIETAPIAETGLVAPMVLTAGFDITPPPTNIAAGDDNDAAAYLAAVRESECASASIRRGFVTNIDVPDDSTMVDRVRRAGRSSSMSAPSSISGQYITHAEPRAASPPRDWEVARVTRPTFITTDEDLDAESVNMASSFAMLDYGYPVDDPMNDGPADVMYFSPLYDQPHYYEYKILDDDNIQHRVFNDAFTQVNLSRLMTTDRQALKDEVQARKQLSRTTNVALQNYKKIVKALQSMSGHLSSASEQFYSIQD